MLYSYSFAQNAAWTREYPGQEEILTYLVRVAQEYNLYQHVRFNSSVEDCTWNDEEKKWKTRVSVASGSKDAEFNPEYTISSDFLVSAVGQLNMPHWPDIPGVEGFEGKKMHSARWDWSYDLKDKRVAMLGNGMLSSTPADSPLNSESLMYTLTCRLHIRPNRPRDCESGKAHHHLPTYPQLDLPPPRPSRLTIHAGRVQIRPSHSMEEASCADGFQRVLSRCYLGWEV
jgi:hypothetical protein